jgi:hypothetical protein
LTLRFTLRFGFRLAAVALVASLVVVAGPRAASTQDRGMDGNDNDDRFSFAIPAQPLEDALLAYAQVTGVEIFFDHSRAAGRKSMPVKGLYNLEAALHRLIEGSGLEVRQAAPHAYTLAAASFREPPLDRAPTWSADPMRGRFFTAVQRTVTQVLCARSGIVPGQYRAALAIWTDPVGRVVEARLLGANVDALSARRLLDSMKGVSVGQAPPAGLQQPVTLVILPRAPEQTGDCASERADRF